MISMINKIIFRFVSGKILNPSTKLYFPCMYSDQSLGQNFFSNASLIRRYPFQKSHI